MIKIIFLLGGGFVFLTQSILLSQINVERGPYLQELTDTSIVICWRTDQATDSRVYFDQNLGVQNAYVDGFNQGTDHKVKLSGLLPNTNYYYYIGSSAQVLLGGQANYRFRTSPIPGSVQPIRVWAIGDFGKGNSEQEKVKDAYLNFTDTIHTDVWLWLGDNAYDDGTDQEYQDKVFDSTSGYGTIMPYMPFMPVPGNHDYMSISPPNPVSSIEPYNHSGPYFDIIDVPTNAEAGGYPSGTELFYSFDYANVHFVSVNSEIGSLNLLNSDHDWIGTLPYFNPLASSFSSSPLTDWLHSDLQQNQQKWTIVYFHQPPYTDGSHTTEAFWEVFMKAMRENIVPILEQYNVDLVLSGHSHVYERSYLIRGHYDDESTFDPNTMIVDGGSGYENLGEEYVKYSSQPNGDEGTVYIVCGNSGSKKDNPGLQYPAMYYGYGCDTCCGSVVLDINGDRLDGKFITMDGDVLDEFTVIKSDSILSIKDQFSDVKWESYPNPFTKELTISLEIPDNTKVSISLLDIKGSLIKVLINDALFARGNSVSFIKEFEGVKKGSYLLKLESEKTTLIKKIIKI